MTKAQRAAHAAKWRKTARFFEALARPSLWDTKCLCYSDQGFSQIYRLVFGGTPGTFAFPLTREGDDCRVIAAGLIAAMYEAGDLDE